MEKPLRRISLMIREDQYQRLGEQELNLSGLIRDLLDDHFSGHAITIAVGPETQKLYSQIVANTGATDAEVEPYLREALQALLKQKIAHLQKLDKTAFAKTGSK